MRRRERRRERQRLVELGRLVDGVRLVIDVVGPGIGAVPGLLVSQDLADLGALTRLAREPVLIEVALAERRFMRVRLRRR